MVELPPDETLQKVFSPLFWGELDPLATPEISFRVFSVVNPNVGTKEIHFIFRVAPRSRTWAGRRVWAEGREVALVLSVSLREFYMEKLTPILLRQGKSLEERIPREVSFHLYESDPRIGRKVEVVPTAPVNEDGQPKLFVKSLLFDPPGGVRYPYVKPPSPIPLTEAHHNRWTRCGKCKNSFELGESVAWGGGYLLWCCTPCADPLARSTLVV